MRFPALRPLAAALLAVALAASGSPAAPAARSKPSPAPQAAGAAPANAALTALRARPWSDDILYFVLVDRFADGDLGNDANVDIHAKGTFHGGDLKGLTAQLDEIASLGVTAIWINPLVQNIPGHVDKVGFPDWAYHGYWADDFTRLDPRFGSESDLKAFVDACHSKGIKVLLDVVYNHVGYGSRYLTDPKTKDWIRQGSECGPDDVTSCVGGLPDFKTELPEVSKYLLDAQLGWAKKSGVDGFRLDTVKHVAHPFWQEHRKRTRAELFPQFFLLGEVWGGDGDVLDPWFEPDELDAGFDFGFQGSALGWVQGRGRTVAFNRYLEKRMKLRPGHLLAHYLSDHDVPGGLFQLEGNVELFRLAAVLELTVSGIPVIYYGEEVARAGGKWPDNRSDFPWGARDLLPGKGAPRDEALRGEYQRLIAIRKAHLSLSRGTHTGLSSDGDLYVFARRDAASGDAVVVAVNRGAAPATVKFAAPAEWGDAPVTDLLDSAAAKPARTGAEVEATVPPHGARIWAAAPR